MSMRVIITPAQMEAIMTLRDNMEAILGSLDEDFNIENMKAIKLTDRFFQKNGYKNKYYESKKDKTLQIGY